MIWEIDDAAPVIEGLDAQGRPDPGYAAALGLRPARTGMRVLAALVEWAIGGIILLPALLVVVPAISDAVADPRGASQLLARGDWGWIIAAYIVSSALMTIYLLLQLILHGRKGVTVGKAMFGIRSVNVRTLERPRFWRGAVVRYLFAWLSFLVPLLGPLLVIALSPLFDPERRGRGWLDMVAATWFVDIRRGLNPYDRKRMRIARKMQKASLHDERPPLPSLATPIDRDAPAPYVPSARTSGGVLAAHREQPAPPAPAGGTLAPAAPPVPPVAGPGAMIDNVPPVLSPNPAPEPAPAPAGYEPRVAQAVAVPEATASEAAESHPAAEPAGTGVRPVLVLDTGVRIEVSRVTLIGRAPAGDATAQLVPIADDTRSVSKTHLAVVPGRRGMSVTDQGSTNGSVIVRDGAELLLSAGKPAELRAGDIVRFGDRSLTVENA